MDNNTMTNNSFSNHNYFGIFTLKFLAILAVLGVVIFLTPNVNSEAYLAILIGAIVVSILDFLLSSFIGIFDLPLGRMLTAFLTSSVIIYGIDFFTSSINVTLLTALLAGLAYAFISGFIPGKKGI